MVQSRRVKFGAYLFDSEEHLLLRSGERIPLSPKVFETLALLLEHRGRVVSKAEFMEALWPDTFVEESNLTQNIFVLRKILGLAADGKPYVETVPKRGYRISTPVEALDNLTDTSRPPGLPSGFSPSPPAPGLERRTGQERRAPAQLPSASRGLGETLADARTKVSETPPAPLAQVSHHHPGPLPHGIFGWHRRSAAWLTTLALVLLAVLLLYLRAVARPLRLSVIEAFRLTDDGVPKNLSPNPSPLVSDGQTLYFTERTDNRSTMASVPLAGGLVTGRPPPFPEATIADFSRKRAQLLIGSTWGTGDRRPIMTVGVGGGGTPVQPPRRIGELTGHDASWSPEGDRIAFVQGRFLQVAGSDGSDVRTLATAPGIVYWPRWSPDGRRLRYSVNFGSNATQLWEVAADGSGPHQILTDLPEHDQLCCGVWSAAGSFFYLAGGPADNDVWVIPAQGYRLPFQKPVTPLKLTVGEADMWRSPLPAPDGRSLYVIGSHGHGELMRLDPATREFKLFLGGLSAEGLSYSPDKAWVAYTAYPEGTLWIAHPDGSGRRRLTTLSAVARFPRWSPDGRTIAFMAGEAGSRWRLFLVTVATGAITPLLEDGGNQGVPSWSSDGRKIAFGRLLDYGVERNPNLNIQIYDLVRHSRTTLPGSEGLWTPRWSPDGRFFAAVTENNRTLRLFDCKTEQWSDLADVGVNDVIWSPDSQFLFFDTVFGAEPSLYRVRLRDRKLQRWADLRGLHRGGFFSPWLGIDPTGTPILLRDTTVEEIYRLTLEATR